MVIALGQIEGTDRLKQWRGLATRTDKLAIAFQAALHLAGILIWTRR
jgi:transposase